MNIEKEILKEHSRGVKRIISYIDDQPARFAELVYLFRHGNPVVSQRTLWVMSQCTEAHPKLVRPHLKMLLKNLDRKDLHSSVKRNTMRLVQFVDLPEHLQGIAANHAFAYLNDPNEAIAVRVFAMTVLGNIALKQPSLRNELILLIQDHLPYGSAGFVSRSRKVLKLLSK